MKIDLVAAFKVINDIYEVRKMTIAERILIRQKKDFINYIAIHFWSIVKTLLVFSGLVLLTQFPQEVPLSLFWVYFFTGLFFLVFDNLGIKAILFFFKKFFSGLLKVLNNMWISFIAYFEKAGLLALKYKMSKRILFWTMIIGFFPIMLIFYFIGLVVIVGVYAAIFILIIFNGNEALSLLITNSISVLLPLENSIVLFVFYGISSVIIYLSVDYRIRMTEGSLVNKETRLEGHTHIIGLKLLNSNNKISIYSKDAEFYVLNNETNILTVFEVNNRLKFKEKEIVDWFNKRKRNTVSMEDGEEDE